MIRSIIHTMFSQGSVAVINLGILLLSTRYLGSEVVGMVSMLILNMAIIQSVNDIFTGPATIHHLSGNSLKRIYKMGLVWTITCTALLNTLFIGLDNIGESFGIDFIRNELRLPLIILSFLSILHYFHVVLFLGREKIRLYNILNLLQPAMMVMFLAVQIFVLERRGLGVSLVSLYLSWAVALGVSSFWILLLVKSDHQTGEVKWLSVLRTGFVNEMGNLAHMLSNRLNYFILGSVALVGVYASSTSLIEKVWLIGGSISPVVLSRIANRQDAPDNAFMTLALAKISFALSVVCTLIIYLLPDVFFTSLLGAEFREVRSLMLYLAPGVLCISFSTIISHYFSGLGKQKVLLMANLSGLAVTVGLSYPLVSRYDMYGAAATASFSYAVQSVVLCVLFWKSNSFRLSEFFRFRLPTA